MNSPKAIQLLFHPESYPGMSKRNAAEIQFLLWQNNSLGNYATWSLMQTKEGFIVRRVVWDQRSTYHLIEPETYCADVLLPNRQANLILESLHDKLNNIPENSSTRITIDGVFYGIIYQDKRIEWYDQSAENPHEFYKWQANTVAYLDALFY